MKRLFRLPLTSKLVSFLRDRGEHVHNVLSFGLTRVFMLGLYAVSVSVFVSRAGSDAYGVAALLLTVFGYLHIVDAGAGYVINLRLARAVARGQQTPWRVVQFGLPIYLTMAIGVSVALFLAAPLVSESVFGSETYQSSIRWLGGSVLLVVLNVVATGILQAYNKIAIVNYTRLLFDVIKNIALVLGGVSGSIDLVVQIVLLGAFLTVVVNGFLAYRLMGTLKWAIPRWNWRSMRLTLQLGLPMMITVLFSVAAVTADKVFVARNFSAEQLGYYSIAYDLHARAFLVVWAFAGSMYTLLIRRKALRRQASDVIYWGVGATVLIFGVYYIPLAVFAPSIIGWWINADVAEGATGAVRTLMLFSVAYHIGCLLQVVLQSAGRVFVLGMSAIVTGTIVVFGLPLFAGTTDVSSVAAVVGVAFAVQAVLLAMAFRRTRSSSGAEG